VSRRARLRQQAKPWQQPTEPTPIPWDQIAQDRAKREQTQQPKGPQ
jgi:hypothetical protein